jgi:predicted ATPase/DNA-binding CsgD family transcriptional regulator
VTSVGGHHRHRETTTTDETRPAVVPNNLPVRLTPFIGRADELLRISSLQRSHRLVSITGAGGAGKTRVALRCAADVLQHYPDGLWWVELAPLLAADAFYHELASVIGARLTPSTDPAESIAARLGNSRALLVLDNCEHLVKPVARLVDFALQRCANLSVLTTSRSPLDVPGEITWRVPPMSLPQRVTSPQSVSSTRVLTLQGPVGHNDDDAVQLFVERARAVRPSFELTDANRETVIEICRGVGGMPLAIELAAARIRTLLPERLLAGLGDALRLLAGGSHLVLPRQQTLQASIDWSVALLGSAERLLFERLSVFTGSFGLDGAEAVCAGDGLETVKILDALEHLVDQSLVEPSHTDDGRFTMLEIVRQHGQRRLATDGTIQHWKDTHAKYLLDRAKSLGPGCWDARQHTAAAALDCELDNIRAALHRFESTGDAHRLSSFVIALDPYWDVSGDRHAGAQWAGRALELLATEPSPTRARLLAMRSEHRMSVGEVLGALEDAQRALDMGTELGETFAAARGSSTLATVLAYVDLDQWQPRWEETVRLQTEAGDLYGLGGTLTWGGVPLLRRGRIRAGKEALARARPVIDECGSPLLDASQTTWEAFAAMWSGDPSTAEALANHALSSAAMLSAARRTGAEAIVAVCRIWQNLERPDWQQHLHDAKRAYQRDELIAYDNAMLLAAIEAIPHHATDAVAILDEWEQTRPKSLPVVRCSPLEIAAVGAMVSGNLDDALRRVTLLRDTAKSCASVQGAARADEIQAAVLLLRNDTHGADELARASIAVYQSNGIRQMVPSAIELLAAIASNAGDHVEAARLLGAVATLRAETGIPLWQFQPCFPATEPATRGALGDATFDAEYAAGRDLIDDRLFEYLERSRGSRRRPQIGWLSLTPTERAVAELVRDGLQNREIAQRLLMGAETVKTHLSHIFSKLDINKRAQLAAIVASQDARVD